MKKNTTCMLRLCQDSSGIFDFIEKIYHNRFSLEYIKIEYGKGCIFHDGDSDKTSSVKCNHVCEEDAGL